MSECKIINIKRKPFVENKTVSIDKKGNEVVKAKVVPETTEQFCARAQETVNNFLKDGWTVVSSNYSLPVTTTFYPTMTRTDFDESQFIFVLTKALN